jgi:peptidoglycan/xylan/chitin deacetylase (PgdA/CDA1 family)
MTHDELRSLASTTGMDVGAHTITHPLLASLDRDEQWGEIQGSRQFLEKLLDDSVTLFSYPYGGPDALSAVTTGLVQKAGYALACTVTGGIARADAHPLLLPRNVVGDWEPARFASWLEGWLNQP